jgi:hypothetical protein
MSTGFWDTVQLKPSAVRHPVRKIQMGLTAAAVRERFAEPNPDKPGLKIEDRMDNRLTHLAGSLYFGDRDERPFA